MTETYGIFRAVERHAVLQDLLHQPGVLLAEILALEVECFAGQVDVGPLKMHVVQRGQIERKYAFPRNTRGSAAGSRAKGALVQALISAEFE